VTAAEAVSAASDSLPFRIGPWSRFALLPFGVREGHRQVTLIDDRLEVRFGWFGASIPVSDIERWDVTGPYRWYRAIGVRHTLFSHDISFCGDASGAIRVWLRSPRKVSWVPGVTEVYLGLEDPLRLGSWLADHGIAGVDLRTA
jgi:hypothetical protein